MGPDRGPRPMLRPWAALAALVVAAGCLSSPAGPPASPGPGSGAQVDPDVVRVGVGDPGVHIEAELTPALALPGQPVTLQAAVVNGAREPFVFKHCRGGGGVSDDDRGETWGFELRGRSGVFEALYEDALCTEDPATARSRLEPGERETLVHTWGEFTTANAEPGPLWANLTFRGLAVSLPFTLGFGEGGGDPVLEVRANRTALRAGESVLLEATVRNPMQRFFRYLYDGCEGSSRIVVATSQGTAWPPPPPCTRPAWRANLAPGQAVQDAVVWDGRWRDPGGHGMPDPGNRTVTATFHYTDGDGRAGVLQASLVLAVG